MMRENIFAPHHTSASLLVHPPACCFDGLRWLITDYQTIAHLLRDARTVAYPPRRTSLAREESSLRRQLVAQQVLFFPAHTHVQAARIIRQALRVQQRTVTTRQVITEAVTRLLDQAVQRGVMDVVGEFARPLASLVAAHILGLPVENEAQLRAWTQGSEVFADYTCGYLHESSEPMERFQEDLLAFVARARGAWSGPETVVGALLAAPQLFPSDHVIAVNLQMLFAAGRTTVEKSLAEGLRVLAYHPDLWRTMRERREEAQVACAVEEWLRFVTPTRYLKRWSVHDIDGMEIGLPGLTIERGQEMLLFLEEANRDPALFTDPCVYHPDRRPNPHLAFGAGVHLCPGAGLARLELSIALSHLLNRLQTLTPHEQTREAFSPNPNLGGLCTFWVRVQEARRLYEEGTPHV